ncbi:MAG: response regulator transcription factor [Oscillospiraceae bacterium]|nr:response regulator transcription factor [Oscillospiraceae bacterium]
MAIRVYLANDYDIIREGLKNILSRNPIFSIAGEFAGNGDLFSNVDRLKPNLLFLDITTRSDTAIKNILKIKMLNPKIMIVALTENEEEAVSIVLNENINGVFLNNFKVEELYKGLSEIITKGSYIQDSIRKKMYDNKQKEINEKYKINSLTKRELEVLIQVANGMFTKEIATSLNISERTVKNHLSNIFKKIEVSDRTQAAVFAIKNSIVNV